MIRMIRWHLWQDMSYSIKLSSWRIQVPIPVEAWFRSLNAWMRGEEIISCNSHIASVNLTDWCIMIFFLRKKKKEAKTIELLDLIQTLISNFTALNCSSYVLTMFEYAVSNLLLRGHPKMSTFSWAYKQYTFSDPLPPPLQVYRPTFLVSKIWVSHKTFIVQQQKINPYFKSVLYVTSDRVG